MLSSFENRVVNLEESVGDMKETLEMVLTCMKELKKDSNEFVLDTLKSILNKLTVRDEVLKALVTVMKEEIAELKRELTNYKVALGSGIQDLARTNNPDIALSSVLLYSSCEHPDR
ncbi:hypothetical protein J1N35_018113 [Gossypium stocksii]|uniref:Uncharacterized protein n=1 Tax=Gossypium stocksii TaxID=47602 RepID=A0A9D3VND4_9ROSI|nr:hypothetical protein J1N35_018113 [Gossypium stocksii]